MVIVSSAQHKDLKLLREHIKHWNTSVVLFMRLSQTYFVSKYCAPSTSGILSPVYEASK